MARRKLIDILYGLGLFFMALLLPLWILRRWIVRKPFLPYLAGPMTDVDFGGRQVLWIQAVSVGEVVAVLPFLKAWKSKYPDWAIYMTTTTVTGQQTAQRLASAYTDYIGYFPLDYSFIVKKALSRIRPTLFVAAESEIWPNFLRFAKIKDIPTAIINGRVSDRSFQRYQKIRSLLSPVWDRIDIFCLQTERDSERFAALGVPASKIFVTGNIKFDIDYPEVNPEDVSVLRQSLGWDKGQHTLTAASTHPSEEDTVLRVFQSLRRNENCRLILAPRHPKRREEVEQILQSTGLTWSRRSEPMGNSEDRDILLVDTFGELGLAYAAGEMVFVGGSWTPIGGHNILEAAAQHRPVAYGPYMQNFHEIESLFQEAGVGFTVADEAELVDLTLNCWSNADHWARLGERAYALVQQHRGATETTIEKLMRQGPHHD